VKANVEEDLTPEQTDGVTIHYATFFEDVLKVALPQTQKDAVLDEEVREEVLATAQ
jgi:ATP-dependent Lon protease